MHAWKISYRQKFTTNWHTYLNNDIYGIFIDNNNSRNLASYIQKYMQSEFYTPSKHILLKNYPRKPTKMHWKCEKFNFTIVTWRPQFNSMLMYIHICSYMHACLKVSDCAILVGRQFYNWIINYKSLPKHEKFTNKICSYYIAHEVYM